MEEISSPATFLVKFGLTATWIGGYGVVTAVIVMSSDPFDRALRPQLFLMWLLTSFVFWYAVGRVKRVRLDGDHLLISNYLKEVRLPASMLKDVCDYRGRMRTIVLTFGEDTPFGRRVAFIPVTTRGVGVHPVVERLRTIAGLGGRPPV